MAEEITPEVFDHLVSLAALELDEKQAAYLRKELNKQLTAIHELEAIPLEKNMPITSHGVPYTLESSPALREDEWVPFEDPAEILSQSPETQDRYIVVPDIPHEKLD